MGEAGGKESTVEGRDLAYKVREGVCDPRDMAALKVRIETVKGTSERVAPGTSFQVCGHYKRERGSAAGMKLMVAGRSKGNTCPLLKEEGTFVVKAQVLTVAAGQERFLDLVMVDYDGVEKGVRARLELVGEGEE